MPVDNAHKILDIYAFFKSMPGHVLISNNFLAVGNRQRWNPFDLQEGIEQANRSGWIERAEHGWRLTKDGYDEAERLRR